MASHAVFGLSDYLMKHLMLVKCLTAENCWHGWLCTPYRTCTKCPASRWKHVIATQVCPVSFSISELVYVCRLWLSTFIDSANIKRLVIVDHTHLITDNISMGVPFCRHNS